MTFNVMFLNLGSNTVYLLSNYIHKMKKYSNLGELLIDFRELNSLTQTDFAAKLGVDTRTIVRWEKNTTLIKPQKEDVLVEVTFIPSQVIRNLNAFMPIPTYYDFRLRKFSLDPLSNNLPDLKWYMQRMESVTSRIRPIKDDNDIDNILRGTKGQYHGEGTSIRELIKEAVKLLPELNFMLVDQNENYSGHCVVFPIGEETLAKLEKREITERQLSIDKLTNFKSNENSVFHLFEITADTNDNTYYMLGSVLRFFRDLGGNKHHYSSIPVRGDTYSINEQLGLELIWDDAQNNVKTDNSISGRFYKGRLTKFLSF